jgi:hypothetical protein
MAAAKPAVKRVRKPSAAPANQPAAWIDDLCIWLANGKTLREFCRQPNRPSFQRIYDALDADAAAAGRVARARDIGFDTLADECGAIADDGENDWMESNAPNNPGWVANGEHIQRSKLRIETRLKLLACWNPKKYGNKQEVEHKGTMSVVISKEDAGVL